MVKHIVFWNVRNDDQKKHNMEEMKKRLTALVGKVDGLISAEVGFNFNEKREVKYENKQLVLKNKEIQ